MILTDREIQTAIEHGQIIVDPPPPATAYSSTSVDLTLSKHIRVWKTEPTPGIEPQVFCPVAPGYNFHEVVKKHSDSIEIPPQGYIMEPRTFILGWTAEEIELPLTSRIAARVEGKSSLARLGRGCPSRS